jgi:uncharacterized protein (TIGR00369 family)
VLAWKRVDHPREATLSPVSLPDPTQFEPLPDDIAERWSRYGQSDDPLFVNLVGISVAETRTGYCRIVAPHRAELMQAGGSVHGGVLATLIDTACVPALGSSLAPRTPFATVDLHIQYVGAARAGDDLTAAAWIVKQGRSVAFLRAEVETAAGRTVATGSLTFSY